MSLDEISLNGKPLFVGKCQTETTTFENNPNKDFLEREFSKEVSQVFQQETFEKKLMTLKHIKEKYKSTNNEKGGPVKTFNELELIVENQRRRAASGKSSEVYAEIYAAFTFFRITKPSELFSVSDIHNHLFSLFPTIKTKNETFVYEKKSISGRLSQIFTAFRILKVIESVGGLKRLKKFRFTGVSYPTFESVLKVVHQTQKTLKLGRRTINACDIEQHTHEQKPQTVDVQYKTSTPSKELLFDVLSNIKVEDIKKVGDMEWDIKLKLKFDIN